MIDPCLTRYRVPDQCYRNAEMEKPQFRILENKSSILRSDAAGSTQKKIGTGAGGVPCIVLNSGVNVTYDYRLRRIGLSLMSIVLGRYIGVNYQ